MSHESIAKLHRNACEKQLRTYVDPETGYDHFTEWYLLDRGYCCLQGCRHCPYTQGPGIHVRYQQKKK